MTKSVINDQTKRPKIIVNASQAKNSSSLTIDINPKIVVIVVRIMGWSLDFPACVMAVYLSMPFFLFLLMRSINTIASLTTIPVNAIKPMPNDIL